MGLKSIKDVELLYPVEQIKAGGFEVWPIIRIEIGMQKNFGNTVKRKSKLSLIFNMFLSMFYGFFNWFGKYDYLVFSNDQQRKKVDGVYYDKSAEYIAEKAGKSLFIEKQVIGHIKRENIATKSIVSKSILYPLITLYYKFLMKKPVIENEDILKKVLNELNVNIDYKYFVNRVIAEYIVIRFLLRIYKPRMVFVVCSYTQMGVLKACAEAGIKVVELQHGVISKAHFGYNTYNAFSRDYFPDYLITYGLNEKNVFEDNYFINQENVFPAGNLYLELLMKNYRPDARLEKISENYKRVVAVSSQIAIEEKLINFLIESAKMDLDILYVFIPRYFNKEYVSVYKFPDNIIIVDWLNFYEITIQADLHSTVYSTTAIEALSLGIQNILINIDDKANEYFGEILTDKAVTRLVETPKEFVSLINQFKLLDKTDVRKSNEKNIVPGYWQRVDDLLPKIIN